MMKQLTIFAIVLLGLFSCFELATSQVKEGIEIGQKAPDIKLKNPDGNVMSLSGLKGKLVLIDFWASWCGPCRRENPNVVNAYNQFKSEIFKNGKGFTVFGVSLDNNQSAWKQAIAADGLVWENHVSDLAGWNNKAAVMYNIHGIPSNLLIDGNGIIIAKNLRGPALIQALSQLKK